MSSNQTVVQIKLAEIIADLKKQLAEIQRQLDEYDAEKTAKDKFANQMPNEPFYLTVGNVTNDIIGAVAVNLDWLIDHLKTHIQFFSNKCNDITMETLIKTEQSLRIKRTVREKKYFNEINDMLTDLINAMPNVTPQEVPQIEFYNKHIIIVQSILRNMVHDS